MPKKYARKKVAKKTVPKKSYARKKTGILMISRPGQVIPRTAHACFKTRYKFGVLGTSSVSQQGSVVIKLNSLFKPFNTGSVDGTNIYDVTGFNSGAAQPAGFAQYCSTANGLYLYNRCYKSSIRITTMGGQLGKAYNFCCFPVESGATVGDYERCTNYPNSKVANFASIYKPRTITNTMQVSKLAGVENRNVLIDDNFIGTDVADPAADFHWIVAWQSSNNAVPGSGGDPIFEIELTQWCRLEQPNLQDVSSSQ